MSLILFLDLVTYAGRFQFLDLVTLGSFSISRFDDTHGSFSVVRFGDTCGFFLFLDLVTHVSLFLYLDLVTYVGFFSSFRFGDIHRLFSIFRLSDTYGSFSILRFGDRHELRTVTEVLSPTLPGNGKTLRLYYLLSSSKPFSIFITFFAYCLFIEQYMYISICWDTFMYSFFFNTNGVYIVYIKY